MRGGARYICFGADLSAVLAKYGIEGDSPLAVEYGASRTYVINAAREGRISPRVVLHTRRRRNAGRGNSTDLKIYGNGVVLDDVSALRCAASDLRREVLPRKTPQISEQGLLDSTFYCAIEPSDGEAARLLLLEGRAPFAVIPVREMEYPYNDHRVAKKVRCRGVLLSDIIDSLHGCGGEELALPGRWKMQYLEEDGLSCRHADLHRQPGRRTRLQTPDAGHGKSERCSSGRTSTTATKDLSARRKKQCAYRTAESANESAVKGLMGVVIREDSSLPSLAECRIRMFDAENGALIAEKKVRGALSGMRAVIAAPRLERYAAPEPQSVVITAAGRRTRRFLLQRKSLSSRSWTALGESRRSMPEKAHGRCDDSRVTRKRRVTCSLRRRRRYRRERGGRAETPPVYRRKSIRGRHFAVRLRKISALSL